MGLRSKGRGGLAWSENMTEAGEVKKFTLFKKLKQALGRKALLTEKMSPQTGKVTFRSLSGLLIV